MGVQESKATRCDVEVQTEAPNEVRKDEVQEITQENIKVCAIKSRFRRYAHKNYDYKFSLIVLQTIARKYLLDEISPKLTEYQIFIILYNYYNELIESGEIRITFNKEYRHEYNLNDLESVARAIKEEQPLFNFEVSDITLILSAYQNKMKQDINDLEAIAKDIKEEHTLDDFRVPDIAVILFAYQIKMKNNQD